MVHARYLAAFVKRHCMEAHVNSDTVTSKTFNEVLQMFAPSKKENNAMKKWIQ